MLAYLKKWNFCFQVLEYFNGDSQEKECIDKIVFATRQLAKRQMTWMRGMENLNIFDFTGDAINKEIKAFIKAQRA